MAVRSLLWVIFLAVPLTCAQTDDEIDLLNVPVPVPVPAPEGSIPNPTPSPTPLPTASPTQAPSLVPTQAPSLVPTQAPSLVPTLSPNPSPTGAPSPNPTHVPSPVPTHVPSPAPTLHPIPAPTHEPSPVPTLHPIPAPTHVPSPAPTLHPIPAPTYEPSSVPTLHPIPAPTNEPSPAPTHAPSAAPTLHPIPAPTLEPSPMPTLHPTPAPTAEPSSAPTHAPSLAPTHEPSSVPTLHPIPAPTFHPTAASTMYPTIDVCAPMNESFCADEYAACDATECGALISDVVNERINCTDMEDCFAVYYNGNVTDINGTLHADLVDVYNTLANLTGCIANCVDPTPFEPKPRPGMDECSMEIASICYEEYQYCSMTADCADLMFALAADDFECYSKDTCYQEFHSNYYPMTPNGTSYDNKTANDNVTAYGYPTAYMSEGEVAWRHLTECLTTCFEPEPYIPAPRPTFEGEDGCDLQAVCAEPMASCAADDGDCITALEMMLSGAVACDPYEPLLVCWESMGFTEFDPGYKLFRELMWCWECCNYNGEDAVEECTPCDASDPLDGACTDLFEECFAPDNDVCYASVAKLEWAGNPRDYAGRQLFEDLGRCFDCCSWPDERYFEHEGFDQCGSPSEEDYCYGFEFEFHCQAQIDFCKSNDGCAKVYTALTDGICPPDNPRDCFHYIHGPNVTFETPGYEEFSLLVECRECCEYETQLVLSPCGQCPERVFAEVCAPYIDGCDYECNATFADLYNYRELPESRDGNSGEVPSSGPGPELLQHTGGPRPDLKLNSTEYRDAVELELCARCCGNGGDPEECAEQPRVCYDFEQVCGEQMNACMSANDSACPGFRHWYERHPTPFVIEPTQARANSILQGDFPIMSCLDTYPASFCTDAELLNNLVDCFSCCFEGNSAEGCSVSNDTGIQRVYLATKSDRNVEVLPVQDHFEASVANVDEEFAIFFDVHPRTRVMINGTLALGGTLAKIPLNVGPNVFNLTIVAASGDSESRILIVRRAGNSDARLMSLRVSTGNEDVKLDPEFQVNRQGYYVTVPNEVTSVIIIVKPNSDNVESIDVNGTLIDEAITSVGGDGQPLLEYGSGALSVPVGESVFVVNVTAEDGSVRSIGILVSREEPFCDGHAALGDNARPRVIGQSCRSREPVGGSCEAKCVSGYVYASGGEIRNCLDDGSFTGEPYTCAVLFQRPDAPTVRLQSGSATMANVAWPEVDTLTGPAIDEYRLSYRSFDQVERVYPYNGTDLTTTVTLPLMSAFFFYIEACSSLGCQESRRSALFQTPGAPSAPRISHLEYNMEKDVVTFEWRKPFDDGGADIADFTVQTRDNGGAYGDFDDENTTDTLLEVAGADRGVQMGEQYYYQVRANNEAGLSGPYRERFFRTPDPPQRPDAPFFTRGLTLSPESVYLAWDVADDGGERIIQYLVEYRIIGSASESQPAWSGAAKRARIDGLADAEFYEFFVSAENSVGFSNNSEPIQLQTFAASPPAPTNVAVHEATATTVEVHWDAPTAITRPVVEYRVDIARDLGGNLPLVWNPLVRTEDEGTVVEFLRPNTDYQVRVLARNALSGFGDASEPTEFTTLVRAPDTPRGFRVLDRTDSVVALIWNDNDPNVDYYAIEVRLDGDAMWTNETDNATSPYIAEDLDRSTTYHFRISAHNAGGQSSYREVTTTTLAELPSAPDITEFSLDGVTEDHVMFSWDTPDDGGAQILAYLVRPTQGGVTGNVQVASSTSLALIGLTENTEYGFEVAAVNRIGLGPFSAMFNVTTLAARPMIASFMAAGAGDHVLAYSTGDTFTIEFDMDTDQNGTRTEAQINSMFDFSFDVGTLFTGNWTSPSTFVITASNVPSTDGPRIGSSVVGLKADGSILNAAGTSLRAIGTSPVLMGDFGTPEPTTLSGAIAIGELPTIQEDSNHTYINEVSVNETTAGDIVTLQVVISVSNGIFGSGTRQYTSPTGNASTINTALATSVTYKPDADFFGSDALSVTLYNDSVIVDKLSQVFTVESDPDPPSFIDFEDIMVPFGIDWVDVYDELFPTAPGIVDNVTEINGNNVIVSLLNAHDDGNDFLLDPDSDNAVAYVWAPHGELSFSGEPVDDVDYTPNWPGTDPDPVVVDMQGEEVEPDLESWGSTIELSGPIEAVNLALRHLHYRSTTNEIGTETLFLVAEDFEDQSLVVVADISIEYACDSTTEAPAPVSAQLRDNLLGFVIHFSAPLWTQAAMVDCDDIFSESTAEKLGDGDRCFVVAAKVRVRFGAGATLNIDDTISFADDNGLRRCPEGLDVTGTVTLSEPDDAVVPMVDIDAPSSIGTCDDIVIRARKIGGFGGRDAVFIWGSPDGILPTVTSETQAFIINSVDLTAGTSYEITLTALNFLGVASDEVVFTFAVSGLPLPGLAPQGATYVEAVSGEKLRLSVAARLSTCVSQDENRMVFTWSVSPSVNLDVASSTTPSLLVDTSDLLFETEYTFTVVGAMESNSSLSNSLSFTVFVEYSDLVAVISGGSYAEVGQGSPVVLDAGGSIDPDNSSDPFDFTWECETAAEGPCLNRSSQLLEPISLPGDEMVTIESGILSPDTYVFSLMTTKPGRNEAEDNVVRNLVFGDPPEVTIKVLSPITRADSGTVVAGVASDSSGLDLEYQWSEVGSALIFSLESLATDVNSPILVIPDSDGEDIFTPGSEVVLQLTVTAGDVSSSAQVSMYVPAKPSGGQVNLSPDSGEALGTEFTIEFSGWESPVGRLVYAVAALIDGTARFLVSPTASEQATFNIPLTTVDTLRACIIDPSGAFTCVDISVTVTELSEPVFGFAADAMGTAMEDFENLGNQGDIISAARTFALAASSGSSLMLLDTTSEDIEAGVRPGDLLLSEPKHSGMLPFNKQRKVRKISLDMKKNHASVMLMQEDDSDADRLSLFESILDSIEMFAGDVGADESIPSLGNAVEGFFDLVTDVHLAQAIDIIDIIIGASSPSDITATELSSLLMIVDYLFDSYDYFEDADDLSTFHSEAVRILEILNAVSEDFASTILEFAGESYLSPMFFNILELQVDRDVFDIGYTYFADDSINPDGDTFVVVPPVVSVDTSTLSVLMFGMNFFDDTLMGSVVLSVDVEKAVASVSRQIEFEVMVPFSYVAGDCGVGEDTCEPECQAFDYDAQTWTTDDVETVPGPLLGENENVTVTCQVYTTSALVSVQAVPAQPALTTASLSAVAVEPILSAFTFDDTENFTQTLDYEIEVGREQTTVDILPTIRENTGASLSRVLVDDIELPNFDPNTFDGVTPLTVDLLGFDLGDTVVVIEVVAQDLETMVNYTFTFEHNAGSQDITLSSIVPSTGTLVPPFSSGVVDYTIELPFQQPNISFTIGFGEEFQAVTAGLQFAVSPTALVDGGSSQVFALDAPSRATSADAFSTSETVIEFVVTAQDDAFSDSYDVTVTRLSPQTTSSLSNLVLSDFIQDFAFNGATEFYSPMVRFSQEEIVVTPTVSASSYATIAFSGALVADVTSGSAIAVPLTAGVDTSLTITVTSQSGDVSTEYTLNFERQTAQSSSDLSALAVEEGSTLSPTFSASTLAYEVQAPFSEAVIDVTPSVDAADGSTIVIVETNTSVASGEVYAWTPVTNGTMLTVRVVAEDNSNRNYTLEYVRLPASSNSSLCGITFDAADLTTDNAFPSETTFSAGTLNYTVFLPYSSTAFSFSVCLPSGRTAVLSANTISVAVADGEDLEITTTVGEVVNFDIVVTAEDGVATTTYGIVAGRVTAEAVNTLSSLVVSPGVLSPAFPSDTSDYSLYVENVIDSVSFTFALGGAFATYSVDIDGVPAIQSTTFDVELPIAVERDAVSVVEISVTSEAGATNVYTVTITRERDGIDPFMSMIVVSAPAYLVEEFTNTNREYELVIPYGLDCAMVTFGFSPDVLLFDTTNNASVANAPVEICIDADTQFTFEETFLADGYLLFEYIFDVSMDSSFSDTRILSLEVSDGLLMPTFDPFTYSYTISSVPLDRDTITVTPTVNTTNVAEIRDANTLAPVLSGVAYTVDVPSELRLRVSSLGGSDGIYEFNVTHDEAQTINTLTDLQVMETSIVPVFDAQTLSYTASVPYATTEVNVIAVADASFVGDIAVGTGPPSTLSAVESGEAMIIPLVEAIAGVSLTLITVEVTAQNTETRSYTISVIRETAGTDTGAVVEIVVDGEATTLSKLSDTYTGSVSVEDYNVSITADDPTSMIIYGDVAPANAVTVAVTLTLDDESWRANFSVQNEINETTSYGIFITNENFVTATEPESTDTALRSSALDWSLLVGALMLSTFALMQ